MGMVSARSKNNTMENSSKKSDIVAWWEKIDQFIDKPIVPQELCPWGPYLTRLSKYSLTLSAENLNVISKRYKE